MKNIFKANKMANDSYKNKFLDQSMVMVHSAQEQNTKHKNSAILNQTDDVITDDMSDTMLPFHLHVGK